MVNPPMSSPASPSPPPKTHAERLQSLGRANQIRRMRATDKQLIAERSIDARQIIANPPAYWSAARVAVLLLALPAVGHTKAERFLIECGISPSRTIEGLTDLQREKLIKRIAAYCP